MKFNYRNSEQGTYNYRQALKKIERTTIKNSRSTADLKGTMHVNELWSENQVQQVMGSPAFPRDRLKILKIWAGKGAPKAPRISKILRTKT